MLVIYIATVLALLGSDILPSKVHAAPGKSGDSSDSGDGDGFCKNAFKKLSSIIKDCPRPACKCGPSGSISKVDFIDVKTGTSTAVTCNGCTGPQVPITSSTECKNSAGSSPSDYAKFFAKAFQCTNIKLYRCDCPASTVQLLVAPTTPPATTTAAPTTQMVTGYM